MCNFLLKSIERIKTCYHLNSISLQNGITCLMRSLMHVKGMLSIDIPLDPLRTPEYTTIPSLRTMLLQYQLAIAHCACAALLIQGEKAVRQPLMPFKIFATCGCCCCLIRLILNGCLLRTWNFRSVSASLRKQRWGHLYHFFRARVSLGAIHSRTPFTETCLRKPLKLTRFRGPGNLHTLCEQCDSDA